MKSSDDSHLLLRVCQLYYEQDLTQQEVADRLHISRWQVGRLLAEAKRTGMVQIRIVHPKARRRDLERELLSFGYLLDAVVVPGYDDESRCRWAVAGLAAEYLADLRPSPKILAISWGNTMSDLAEQIPPSWADGVRVVQANGGLTNPGTRDPNSILSSLARQARGTSTHLTAPAIVNSSSLAQAIREEPAIKNVMEMARNADVMVYSLGALSQESVLVKSGCITPHDLQSLIEAGAVGDAVARFLDQNGNPVLKDFEQRTIGLTLDELKACSVSIAVTSGARKHRIAKAAVITGLCTVLITDSGTAEYLIRSLPAKLCDCGPEHSCGLGTDDS